MPEGLPARQAAAVEPEPERAEVPTDEQTESEIQAPAPPEPEPVMEAASKPKDTPSAEAEKVKSEPHLAEHEPAVTEPEPTAFEEPAAVEFEESPAEGAHEAAVEEVTADAAVLEEMRDHLKRKRSDHDMRLAYSRALWTAGDVKEAMKNYGALIKSGAKMAEVYDDLQSYLETAPKDSEILKTLGDAYMKDGHLERALEIYNEAMTAL